MGRDEDGRALGVDRSRAGEIVKSYKFKVSSCIELDRRKEWDVGCAFIEVRGRARCRVGGLGEGVYGPAVVCGFDGVHSAA